MFNAWLIIVVIVFFRKIITPEVLFRHGIFFQWFFLPDFYSVRLHLFCETYKIHYIFPGLDRICPRYGTLLAGSDYLILKSDIDIRIVIKARLRHHFLIKSKKLLKFILILASVTEFNYLIADQWR